eukprot:694778-Pleurochrysis_carterae.AAC.6
MATLGGARPHRPFEAQSAASVPPSMEDPITQSQGIFFGSRKSRFDSTLPRPVRSLTQRSIEAVDNHVYAITSEYHYTIQLLACSPCETYGLFTSCGLPVRKIGYKLDKGIPAGP